MDSTVEKTKFETQITDLQEQIYEAERRVNQLIEERAKTNSVVAASAKALSNPKISGREAKREYQAMTEASERLEALGAEISEAVNKTEKLERDMGEVKQKYSALFYDREVKEFESLVLDYVKLFISLRKSYEALAAKQKEISRLGEYGNAPHSASLWRVQRVVGVLNSQYDGGFPHGILAKVGHLERLYPEIVEQARKRK